MRLMSVRSKIRASMRGVTNLLIGGAAYRLHRNGREISKTGFVVRRCTFSTRFSKSIDCGTILGCVAEVAPDDRKTECATRLGALDVTRSSAHKTNEFVSFRTLFNRLFVLGKVA